MPLAMPPGPASDCATMLRASLVCAVLGCSAVARAQAAPPAETTEERLARVERELAELKAKESPPEKTSLKLTFGGYAEVDYSWNFNQPSNSITNYRGFDNRHNSFTIS